MWDLIVSVPDHCLSFYFVDFILRGLHVLKSSRALCPRVSSFFLAL